MSFGPWVIVVFLVVLAIATPRYGADSRDGGSRRLGEPIPPMRPRQTVSGDLVALTRWVSRSVTDRRGADASAGKACGRDG